MTSATVSNKDKKQLTFNNNLKIGQIDQKLSNEFWDQNNPVYQK